MTRLAAAPGSILVPLALHPRSGTAWGFCLPLHAVVVGSTWQGPDDDGGKQRR